MGMSADKDSPPPTWRRTIGGFEPVCEKAWSAFKSVKLGEEVSFKMHRPRNLKHHRKYWILMQIVAENSDDFESPEMVHYAIRAAMGRGKWIQPAKATRQIFIPESISFASMDQDEFNEFYSKAVNVVIKHFMQGLTPEQIEHIVLDF